MELGETISTALNLFNDAEDLSKRVAYMQQNAKAQTMAMSWDATGPVGVAATLFQEAPDFTKIEYTALRSAAIAVAYADLQSEMQNPLLKQTVNLIAALEDAAPLAPWMDAIMRRVLHLRIGMPQAPESEDAAAVAAVSAELNNWLFKKVKGYLGKHPLPQGSASWPQWYVDWKAKVRIKKEQTV